MNSLIGYATGFAIELAVQTAFLTLALWIIIRFQKRDYNFIGLAGSAALSCGLEIILAHFIGWGFASFVVVPVLIFCMTKVTRGDHIDVGFAVAVGYTLTMVMDVWLLGMLMGDLRVSAKSDEVQVTVRVRDDGTTETTNIVEQSPKEIAAAVKIKEVGLRKAIQEMTDKLAVKGVTQGKTPLAMISSGRKTYMLTVGESFVMGNNETNAVVTCKEIEEHKVIVEVEGKPVTLTVPR
jgi:hypothetical protein